MTHAPPPDPHDPQAAGDDLDRRLVGALERAGQALRVELARSARRHGLTPTQALVLLRLTRAPAAGRRIGPLAAELDVTHPTVSDAVAALRRKGLVEPEHGRRAAALRPTVRGLDIARELEAWHDRLAAPLAALGRGDKELALGVLLELIAGLQRAGVVTVARMCVTCRWFRRDAHPGSPQPHHCELLQVPLGAGELRVDCPEHEPEAA